MSLTRARVLLGCTVAMLGLAMVVVAGCGGYGTSGSTTGGSSSGSTSGGSGGTAVSLENFTFVPSQINVAVGGTVTFKNNDSVQHNVAGDSWSSGLIDPGASFSQTFPTAGKFSIRCKIHPSMTATVIVK